MAVVRRAGHLKKIGDQGLEAISFLVDFVQEVGAGLAVPLHVSAEQRGDEPLDLTQWGTEFMGSGPNELLTNACRLGRLVIHAGGIHCLRALTCQLLKQWQIVWRKRRRSIDPHKGQHTETTTMRNQWH